MKAIDVSKVRADFPILRRQVHGKPLVYLDNAATTQKPRAVIDALAGYYERMNANVHRGVHTLADEATQSYEEARAKVARFIGGVDARGVVFTRNATEAINLVARAYVEPRLKPGDEILLTEMEHHANLVPWILVARRTGAVLRHIPLTDEGRLDLARLPELLTKRTRFVSVIHASNVLATINPVEMIAEAAHARGAKILIDIAQTAPHMPVDVKGMGADFVAFSAHKMLGPMGIGVLWGRPELLEATEPMLGGGEMIREVRLDSATWNEIPWKFEAGTPNVGDAIAFGAAIDYLESLGMEAVREHEIALNRYALQKLVGLPGISIHGPDEPAERTGLVSFADESIHPHDLATILDIFGVAVRAGHHCAQPLMRRLGVPATARASYYIYNDPADIDALAHALVEARNYFGTTVR